MNTTKTAIAVLALLAGLTLTGCDTDTEPAGYCAAHPNNASAC